MKRSALLLAGTFVFAFMSCNEGTENKEGSTEGMETVSRAMPELKPVGQSPDYPGASLSIGSVSAAAVGKDSAKVSFKFNVKDYELMAQTADNASKSCNNSSKGQHIHFILDNAPYKALYEPNNEVTLANGTEHYLMAFLSRSYHESVKSPGAALVYHFKIDENGKLVKMDDPATPMVFYSRPKGDYVGADTANLLLDFYVWNCTLGADGYKVKASLMPAGGVPTAQVDFTIDTWASNFINNLTMGKSTLSLTLTDKDGKQVEGPCTSVSREFNLAAGEPMQ